MNKSPEIKQLRVDDIRLDGGTQSRVQIDRGLIDEYAMAMAECQFPPVVVFYDGETYWLADGFHRWMAADQRDDELIAAEVHAGTLRDAILYSVGANAYHGQRRTREDKRKAVETLLNDPEWGQWADTEIAKATGLHRHTVAQYRREISGIRRPLTCRNSTSESPPVPPWKSPVEQSDLSNSTSQQVRVYKTKYGTTARMNTTRIGRKRGSDQPAAPAAVAAALVSLPPEPNIAAARIIKAVGPAFARRLVESLEIMLQE